MKFIKINNRILDNETLRKEKLLVKNHMIICIHDLVNVYGFEKTRRGFVNKNLNMRLELKFSKVEKEVIV